MLAVGQDGMLRDFVEEAVQSFPSGLDEITVEAIHHAFHHKFLGQRLRKHPNIVVSQGARQCKCVS